jgi:hypothetical protein
MWSKHTSGDNHDISGQVRDICYGKLVVVARHRLVRCFRSSVVKVVQVATELLVRIDGDDLGACWLCMLIYIYY